ncbi:MAG: hypothetical protein AAF804_19915, partial [Bacteroidota bacterium]
HIHLHTQTYSSMIAFEVYLNGEKLYTAGLSKARVLTQTLSYKTPEAEEAAKFNFNVSGIAEGDDILKLEQPYWPAPEVKIGDHLEIRIVDVAEEEVTPHQIRKLDMADANPFAQKMLKTMREFMSKQQQDKEDPPKE